MPAEEPTSINSDFQTTYVCTIGLTLRLFRTRPLRALVGLGTKPASLDPGGNTFLQPDSGTASGEGEPHYLIGYQTKSVKPFGGGETREPRLWKS